jgi:4-amino-4-deoxy-L-arabinose transferase-like glycosyltransferase
MLGVAGAPSIDQRLKLSLRFRAAARGAAPGRIVAALSGLPRSSKLALLAVVLAILGGGVWRATAIGGNTHLSADERGYVANANRILAHERYATFKWPPGTSLAFAAATRLSGHRSLRLTERAHGPAQYVQLAFGVLTVALVALLAWTLAGPWAAALASALAASYMPVVLATRTFLSEPAGAFVLIAAIAAAALARSRLGARREWLALAFAGVVGALACLTRGDLAVAMGVVALALALAGRPGWRVGLKRAAIYLGALLVTLGPWLGYASASEGRFVPITTAGPDAFFIGTYLPGKGALVPTEEALAPQVCKRFPEDCGAYWQHSAAPLFKLIRARYPHSSAYGAVMKANLDNVRRYAIGKPAAFASMLWQKFWKMWLSVWSGGNSSFHPQTSHLQHTLYLWFAWLGLLAGIALSGARPARRAPSAADRARSVARWTLSLSAAVLLAVAALATLFNDQPRYNVSLMPLLLCAGVAGAWLTGERLIALRRGQAAGRASGRAAEHAHS